MSTHNYTRTLADGLWDVRVLQLQKEAKAALPGNTFAVVGDGTAVNISASPDLVVPGEVTTLDGVVTAHKTAEVNTYKLPLIKEQRAKKFDVRTEELRAVGWLYSGHYYSLSAQAEAKLNTAWARRNDGDFPYPLRLPSVNNDYVLSLANASALDTAHKTMFTALYGASGLLTVVLDLKESLVAAVDVTAALAVNDPR